MLKQYQSLIEQVGPLNPQAIPVPVYYINLDKGHARRRAIEEQLALYNVPIHRVPAINSASYTSISPTICQVDSLTVQTSLTLKPMQLACTLSHLKAIEQACEHKHPWALICEDDCYFGLTHFWPQDILHHLMTEADKQEIGIVQLVWTPNVQDESTKFQKWSFNLVQSSKPCWGTVAYLISQRGMAQILSYTGPIQSSSRDSPIFIDRIQQRPNYCPKLHEKYKDVEIQGVADFFLYNVASSALCGKPLVTCQNFISTMTPQQSQQYLKLPIEILELYVKMDHPVFVYGSWDLLHSGHLEFLQFAKSLGSSLIVGVLTDDFQNHNFPDESIIEPVYERFRKMKALRFPDFVVEIQSIGDLANKMEEYNVKYWLQDVSKKDNPFHIFGACKLHIEKLGIEFRFYERKNTMSKQMILDKIQSKETTTNKSEPPKPTIHPQHSKWASFLQELHQYHSHC